MNHARVTKPSFSRHAASPPARGASTTTLFCTVLRVTSRGRTRSSRASSCRVQLRPNSDRATGGEGVGGAAFDDGGGASDGAAVEVSEVSKGSAGAGAGRFWRSVK